MAEAPEAPDITNDPNPQDITRVQEEALLKMGYAAMLHERWPVSYDPANCYDRENAYLHSLESEYFEIPDHLRFENIESDIPEEHRERISKIWQKVQEHRRKLNIARATLIGHWTDAEEVSGDVLQKDEFLDKLMDDPPVKLRSEFRSAVRMQIAIPSMATTQPDDISIWKMEDKGHRRQLYDELKNYTMALRLYYSMLVERSDDKTESILPSDHPLRGDLVIRTRYLELLDAVHQSLSGSKAAHHQQGRGRLRKTEMKPYVLHELDVTTATMLDVFPHVIEQDRLPLSTVPLALIGPVHDLAEDTDLSIQEVIRGFVARLVDRYDSSLDPVIQSGFGKTREDVKGKILNLVGESRSARLMQIMKILSNNAKLRPDERKAAIKRHIATVKVTRRAFGISEEEMGPWRIDTTNLPPTAKTFRKFQKDYDDYKMTKFLLRLSAVTKNEQTRQTALVIKIEDRANNISNLRGMPLEKQINTLRSTTTRLIAWCMLDHNRSEYPLYNALPRLIDVSIREYERVAEEHPNIITEKDRGYIEQLKTWAIEVQRFEISEKVKAVLENFDRQAA